jgi:amino acid transporter
VFVFLLTYRDIRLSTTAGVILGAFEILIFGALALWMIFSNTGHLNIQPFNPHHAAGEWSGVFKGMVFAILAFIGFEASAPLGEEAKHPRRTVPIAVVGSALLIGIFYVLCSYAWVFGAGFDNFVKQATTNPDPWRSLGKVFWGGGWVLVFLAICNSIAANSNAAVNAATRVFYALSRNGLAPRWLGHVHRRFRTPDVAIFGMSALALVISLLFGWKWGPLNGFFTIATMAVPPVILVYMLVSAGSLVYYLGPLRRQFNVLLHFVLPIAGIVLFFFPLYYQFVKYPPVYPEKYGNWVDYAWLGLGIALTLFVVAFRPGKIADMERVYVEDERETPEERAATFPTA